MKIELKTIVEIVCKFYNIPAFKIGQKYRKREFADCRKVIYYFCDKYTDYSHEDIAFYIANQNRYIIRYSVEKVLERLTYDKKFINEIAQLEKDIEYVLFGNEVVIEHDGYKEIIYKSKGFLVCDNL